MRVVFAASILAIACGLAAACKSPDLAVADGPPTKKKLAPAPELPVTKAPKKHRAEHVACSKADTPSSGKTPFERKAPEIGGPCTTKADCKEQSNGRCSGGSCTYDECYDDADCKDRLCSCQEDGKVGYRCMPGDCAIDSDCGAKGFCSPSWHEGCGAFIGVVGWFCHRPEDECTNDDDCTKSGKGFCAYSQEKKHWRCGYGVCKG
jgi:hypothetical protein